MEDDLSLVRRLRERDNWVTSGVNDIIGYSEPDADCHEAADAIEHLTVECAKAERLWKQEAIRAERAETTLGGMENGLRITLARTEQAELSLERMRKALQTSADRWIDLAAVIRERGPYADAGFCEDAGKRDLAALKPATGRE